MMDGMMTNGAEGTAEQRAKDGDADRPAASPEKPKAGMMAMMMSPNPPRFKPQGTAFADITDGTSNTIFLVVARDATPWTKPGELPFVPGQDLPGLDDGDSRGFILGMCDGSIRTLRPSDLSKLPALITRSAGEIVDGNWFADPTRPPTPTAPVVATTDLAPPASSAASSRPAAPVSPASSGASVEERLQRLEEKYDRLLEKLDAK
jgi:hypothetical protein